MPNHRPRTDIVVAGGGLSGFAAAIALAKAGRRVLHVAPEAAADSRTSALMVPSVAFLEELAFTDDVKTLGTPLRNIRIIDATRRLIRAPESLFESGEAGLEAFGWNFPNSVLLQAMQAAAEKLPGYTRMVAALANYREEPFGMTVEITTGERVDCALLVGADGKSSRVREIAGIPARRHDYGQSALVCDLKLSRDLNETSVEFHYPNGPFTLVPADAGRSNLVWVDRHEVLEAASRGDASGFERLLYEKSQHIFGPVRAVSKPVIFPLSALTAAQAGAGCVALVGESAHAFAPLGAQGLNLSLRDVASLAAAVKQVDGAGPGWGSEAVARYAERRRADQTATTLMVNTLFGSLLTELLPAQMARSAGIWALKTLPGLRRRAFNFGIGAR